jgi:hypothetical protein
MLAAAIVITILILSTLVDGGQAVTLQQTVPTARPTETIPPNPTSTQGSPATIATSTSQPDATNPAVQQPTSTMSTDPTQVQVEQTAVGGEPTSTEVGTGAPIASVTPTIDTPPTQTGTVPAPEGWLKSLYFLVCGLSVVAGIAIIILMAVRKAAKNTAPPSPPGPTG